MRRSSVVLPVLVPLLLLACETATLGNTSRSAQGASSSTQNATPPAHAAPPAAQGTSSPATAARPDASAQEKKLVGVFVPVESSAIAIWPEAYAGELVVLQALAHGSRVEQGTVIAELDPRAIEDQLRDAGLETKSAQIRHEGLLQRNVVEEAAAQASLASTQAALDRSRRALEGWKTQELAFAERADELALVREAANVEDQKDELAQLEAMYKADELTDATEEIVLKRSRRALATTEQSQGLARDRRRYDKELSRQLDLAAREDALHTQELALARMLEAQAIDRRAREDAAARSAATLAQQTKKLEKLQRDRELFSVRAPRAGVLLHGAAKSLRAGPAVRQARGTVLPSRTEVFVVADPERMALAFDVPESRLATITPGARIVAVPLAHPENRLAGTLRLEGWPGPRPVGDENGYEATVELDSGAPGLVFGMKARIELAESNRSEG